MFRFYYALVYLKDVARGHHGSLTFKEIRGDVISILRG
jgi:hypothetical protein